MFDFNVVYLNSKILEISLQLLYPMGMDGKFKVWNSQVLPIHFVFVELPIAGYDQSVGNSDHPFDRFVVDAAWRNFVFLVVDYDISEVGGQVCPVQFRIKWNGPHFFWDSRIVVALKGMDWVDSHVVMEQVDALVLIHYL